MPQKLSNSRRRKSFAVLARENFLVRLLVIAETEVRGVPAQFLSGKTRRFDREQSRFGDAPANLEWCPERLFGTEAVIRPILPMIALADFRHRFVFHFLALAEDLGESIRLQQPRS